MERYRSRRDIIGQLQYETAELTQKADHPDRFTTFEDWRRIGVAGNPAFQSGWTNYNAGAGGFPPASFWKNSSGMVLLQGLIASGTAGTIFTLPVGYRPGQFGGSIVRLYAVHAGGAEGRIDIYYSGEVNFVQGSNGYVQLDGITFRAEK